MKNAERIVMQTKLQMPQLPDNFVARQALNEKLNTGHFVLVSAFAGSGKTTAVCAWLRQLLAHKSAEKAAGQTHIEVPTCIWYRLDDWDNDLEVFLSHLTYGLDEAVGCSEGKGFKALLDIGAAMGEEALLRAIVAKLEAHQAPLIMVFDDYHEVTHSAIHRFVSLLLQHLEGVHRLCLITREDPPLLLAKHRAAGKLTTIREADLRMVVDEAKALLDSRLTEELVSYIHERTEGWVAGIQLTGQTLRALDGMEALSQFVYLYRESKVYMLDYLLEEVLNRQPASVSTFLINTSVLDDFCPELLDYALELPEGYSEEMLRHLVRVNCFVIALSQSDWYRYHQLFKELLRQRANDRAKGICQRAGAWFEERGQIQQAIHYYIQSEPLEAARLIEGLWSTMDLEFRSKAWLDLAKRLPEAIVQHSPIISAGWGWALLNNGETDEAIPWLESAQQLYEQKMSGSDEEKAKIYVFDQGEYSQLSLSLISAKAYVCASKGDFEGVQALNAQLTASAERMPYQRLWVIDTYVSTVEWSRGNLEAAISAMLKAQQSFGKPGQQFPVMVRESLVWVIAAIQIEKGDLYAAKTALEAALIRVKPLGIGPILAARYKLYMAEIAAIKGDFAAAFKALKESEAEGLLFDTLDWRQSYELLLAKLYAVQGLFELARAHIKQGRTYVQQNPIPETISFDDLSLYIDLATGETAALESGYLREMLDSPELPEYTKEFRCKCLLRYLDQGQTSIKAQGYALCLRFLDRAKQQKRLLHAIDYELLAARLSTNEGRRQHHEAEANRLSHISNQAPLSGKARQLLLPHILWGNRTLEGIDHIQHVNVSLLEPLTSREIELLRLIAEGLSNEEIGQRLYITLSTVKSYNNTLYAKLGVKRRTEAIFKARDLGLI